MLTEMHSLEERCLVDDGEAILNKKAVYEPSKGQRFRQIACSRSVAFCILLGMGATMITVALIAAFARPASMTNSSPCVPTNSSVSTSQSQTGALSNDSSSNAKTPPDFIATNGEEFPWKDLRLPRSVVPKVYEIFLHPNISQSFFQGKVHMTLQVVEQTDIVVFHTRDLNLSGVSVSHTNTLFKKDFPKYYNCSDPIIFKDINMDSTAFAPKIGVKKQLEYVKHEQYYLQLEEQLAPGTLFVVTVDFRGSLADLAKMTGLYKSAYMVNGEKRYMISTHFEPSDARTAFPCMDEPELKAMFIMSIVRDKNFISLFNSERQKNEPYGNGLVKDVYKTTVCMSTYLVAYVVTDFKKQTSYADGGIKVRVFAPEDKIYMGKFALDAAVDIIKKYNKFFGIAYPLDKLDLIAIPNFSAGAMENWGLITYRDTSILYDPDKSTLYSKKWVAIVVAHEIAHQWFGNLVTMKWWNDLWLNEGFASYMENVGAEIVDPTFKAFEGMVANARGSLKLDSLASSEPVQVEVADPAQAASAFNSITYNKGAILINMLKGAIGENDFHKGLNYYLKTYAYSNAETKQLWDALDKNTNLELSVSKVMDTWTKQMGYPVVTVTRKDNQITLTQERFLLNNKSESDGKESPYQYTWYVPFKYKLSDDATKAQLIWLKRGSATIQLPSSSISWIKGNTDSEGFYRVNYDGQGWKAITKQLMDDHTIFSVEDRISLVDDVFNLARSGRVSYAVALDLCQYMQKEDDYYVWSTFVSNIGVLDKELYLHPAYDDLKSYLLHSAQSLIDRVGWEDIGSFKQKLLRSQMISLALELEYPPAVNKTLEMFGMWLADDSIKLNRDLQPLIYRTGVKYGNKSHWDVVYERFKKSIIPSETDMLMHALSSSKDARVLQILLERSLDSSQIKSQSTSSVLGGVAANPTGTLYTWRFLQMNWDTIFDRYGSGAFTLANILKNVLGHFSSQFDLDQVTSFFQGKDMGSAKRALDQVKETIATNIAWKQHYLEPVAAWLKKASASHKSQT